MSKKTTFITREYLASKRACGTYLEWFEQLFPNGVEVTSDKAVEVVRYFDWEWAIRELLEGTYRDEALLVAAGLSEELSQAYNAAWAEWDDSDRSELAYTTRRSQARSACEVCSEAMARQFALSFRAQGGRPLMEGEVESACPERRTLKITYDYLYSKRACDGQTETFSELFPDGIEVTVQAAVEHAYKFDWAWAYAYLLESGSHHQQVAMSAESEAWSVKHRQMKDTYEMPEGDIRREAQQAAVKQYREAAASIFANAFIAQGGRPLMEGEQA